MAVYAVIYTYTSDDELRAATRPVHREYLEGVEGLLVAGAWTPGEPPGGLLVFRADDRADVEKIVAADPYTTGGIVASTDIREWGPALGPAAAALTP